MKVSPVKLRWSVKSIIRKIVIRRASIMIEILNSTKVNICRTEQLVKNAWFAPSSQRLWTPSLFLVKVKETIFFKSQLLDLRKTVVFLLKLRKVAKRRERKTFCLEKRHITHTLSTISLNSWTLRSISPKPYWKGLNTYPRLPQCFHTKPLSK